MSLSSFIFVSILRSLLLTPSNSPCDTPQARMPEASFFLLALSLFVLFSFLPLVSSQNSNATCLSSFEWVSNLAYQKCNLVANLYCTMKHLQTNNSRGQNPCLVEAYLQAVCQPGKVNLCSPRSHTNFLDVSRMDNTVPEDRVIWLSRT